MAKGTRKQPAASVSSGPGRQKASVVKHRATTVVNKKPSVAVGSLRSGKEQDSERPRLLMLAA
eukprot:1151007-Amphidinium_carterae.1